ncbi:D-alanyl-D-alanine carboxypeptidase/D-alanyl-D-alanine-endopeptidase [Brevibacillus humidisoli]|uniref:D-alanyl-D-alanine carboxypeptidase/D-alanyl-D-alanine endopeptidase n=1 Tax=Brevibacillus humidisoli TaxID=2895522 RepID=UPI001E539B8F|nr:D-alanyl-D-alanine carboxypeptidase/D-alanyl-D-alanine-endopeptidase [Brevibacillus humidisoli]UFJ38997.1 D-alanyl-D-alanine carboxypeptidase/D-alanyl-D-alanine-endopeptidase [Brevibacillus humidisoli]
MRLPKGIYCTWLVICLLLFQVVAVPQAVSAAEETADKQLAAHIEKLLADLEQESASRGMSVGIAVYNLTKQEYLYAYQKDKAFVPASNLKLLVTLAALERLGPDFRYKTEVYADGKVTPAGVLEGDLVLKGYGDPSFALEDLNSLVSKLKEAGVKRITGSIKVDESYFDDVRLGPAWMWDDEVYGYSAQLSGLTLNRNAVTVKITPDQAIGAAPTLQMIPANDYVTLQNEVKIVEGQQDDLTYERPRGQNTITISGTIGKQAEPIEEPLAVEDPALFVGNALKHQLISAGISLNPQVTIAKDKLDKGTPLVTHYSQPLAELIKELNKESDNFYAESLLKTLGAELKGEGSFAAGSEAVADVLQDARIVTGYQQVDGSGLSRLNLIAPDHFIKLLAYVQEQEYKEVFEASLPIAGGEGTLENRFLDTPAANNLMAKTGSMSGVNCLSGYVTAENGDKLAFSILSNGIYKSKYARDLQDQVGTLLASYPNLSVPDAFTPVDPQQYELSSLLDPIVTELEKSGATAGVIVKSLDRQDEQAILYAHNADKLFTPASNAKLLTSLTALRQLGADYRFKTELYLTGPVNPGGVLTGDLIIKGYGDPTLHTEDSLKVQEGVSIEEIVEQINEAGIKVIQGDIIVDDHYFDDQRLGLGWAWDDESYYYNAQTSALSINRGTVRIDYQPGERGGEQVELTLSPQTQYVQIVNEAKTVDADAENTFSIERVRGQNMIRVTGNLPLGAKADYERIAVEEPALYTGTVLLEKLREAGIKAAQSKVKAGEVPDESRKLAEFASQPLKEIITYLNKNSDNHYAEMMTKVLGAEKKAEGSTGAGIEVIYETVSALGVDETFDLFDASGLTRYNLIAPRQLLTALEAMAEQPEFESFLGSLPVAGADGTLKNRMKGTRAENNVRAKTGTLTGVSSLSGYVSTQTGERLAFSIMINGHIGDTDELKALEDRIVAALAGYRGETALLPLFLTIAESPGSI